MTVVVQEEEKGCGIAAVANILGLPYAAVKTKANAMGIHARDDLLFSDTRYVRDLLAAYGVPVSEEERPFQGWDELPDIALLAIKHRVEAGVPYWHWVVFVRRDGPRVLDSAAYLESNMRTDFENMRPKWFIEVFTRS